MLNASIFRNKRTGEVFLVNNMTGEVYKGQKGFAGLGLGPLTNDQQAAADGTNVSFWNKIGNTFQDLWNDENFQNLLDNVSFRDGQFSYGSGGGSITTPPVNTGGGVTQPGSGQAGIDKSVWIIGGSVLALGVLIYVASKS